jgi:hypothetical protein
VSDSSKRQERSEEEGQQAEEHQQREDQGHHEAEEVEVGVDSGNRTRDHRHVEVAAPAENEEALQGHQELGGQRPQG